MLARRFHRSGCDLRCALRQRAENSAAMKPADTILSENLLPVHIAGFHLRYRRVPSIGAAEGSADAKAALDEIQSVANSAAYAVVRRPADNLVHAALIHQIFDQPANGIVGERGHMRSVEAEAALQSARHVVLAAA